jgi:hypothetical protein
MDGRITDGIQQKMIPASLNRLLKERAKQQDAAESCVLKAYVWFRKNLDSARTISIVAAISLSCAYQAVSEKSQYNC